MKFKISDDRRTLTILLGRRERAVLRALPEIQSDRALHDSLEPMTCNSELDWINPADTGDLTSAPMLGLLGDDQLVPLGVHPSGPSGVVRAGAGTFQPILERWAFMDYQLRSPLDDLRDHGKAVFVRGAPVKAFSVFKARFGALCESHGGRFNERDTIGEGAAYHIPTAWGTLRASIHRDAWKNARAGYSIEAIFLQWRDYAGPTEFPLHGDFNHFSHKWNILVSAGTLAKARKHCLAELKVRLELLPGVRDEHLEETFAG